MIYERPRALSRLMMYHHIAAGMAAALAIIVTAAVVAYDRATPMIFMGMEARPIHVRDAEFIYFRWTAVWYRQCRAKLFQEVAGSDGVVKVYRPFRIPVPARRGVQIFDGPSIQVRALPLGFARYRAIAIFDDCGLTSRWWPLRIEAPGISFEVVK